MFKRKTAKQFDFKTRYYNPEEEERERRRKRAERKKQDYNFDSDEFRSELSYRWGLNRESNSDFNKKTTSVNRALLFSLIAALLIGILAYMRS